MIPFGLRLVFYSFCEKGIRAAAESSNRTLPISTLLKCDTELPGICEDYGSTLNKCPFHGTCITEKSRDRLYHLAGSSMLLEIDHMEVYSQIPLGKEWSTLPNINTPFGLYWWCSHIGLSVSHHFSAICEIYYECAWKVWIVSGWQYSSWSHPIRTRYPSSLCTGQIHIVQCFH